MGKPQAPTVSHAQQLGSTVFVFSTVVDKEEVWPQRRIQTLLQSATTFVSGLACNPAIALTLAMDFL